MTSVESANGERQAPVVAEGFDAAAASTSMELMLEHVALGELAQEAWFGRGQPIDVLHSSVDRLGYDVVLECNRVIRHVQFKGRRLDARTRYYNINTRLAEHPSGCIVWMGWAQRPGENRVGIEYRWFGGSPGDPLPDLGGVVAKHVRTNARGEKTERPHIRRVNVTSFEKLGGADELLDRLFFTNGQC